MDKNYWDKFYGDFDISNPSPFAEWLINTQFVNTNIRDKTILELGCGNGRDAIFFSKNGLNVNAIDQSEISINKLNNLGIENIYFQCGNFTKMDTLDYKPYIIYSRFTLHSITKEEADNTLLWVYNNLSDNGYFCIEVRSVNDDLYGDGDEIERDAFITDHYRRFIRFDELRDQLTELGFSIIFMNESNKYAQYKDKSPFVIRVIVEKNNE